MLLLLAKEEGALSMIIFTFLGSYPFRLWYNTDQSCIINGDIDMYGQTAPKMPSL